MWVITNQRVASRQGKITYRNYSGRIDTHKTLLINPRYFVGFPFFFFQGVIYDMKPDDEIKPKLAAG